MVLDCCDLVAIALVAEAFAAGYLRADNVAVVEERVCLLGQSLHSFDFHCIDDSAICPLFWSIFVNGNAGCVD